VNQPALLLYATLLCAILGALFGFLYYHTRPVVAYLVPIGCLAAAMLVYEPAHPIVVMLACSVVMPFMMARGLNVARKRGGITVLRVPRGLADEMKAARDEIVARREQANETTDTGKAETRP
jgi:hypothetical protein